MLLLLLQSIAPVRRHVFKNPFRPFYRERGECVRGAKSAIESNSAPSQQYIYKLFFFFTLLYDLNFSVNLDVLLPRRFRSSGTLCTTRNVGPARLSCFVSIPSFKRTIKRPTTGQRKIGYCFSIQIIRVPHVRRSRPDLLMNVRRTCVVLSLWRHE